MDAAYADIGERLEAGEPEALEDCYRTLGPLVMSYLTRYVQQADIQDVMQRVFYEVRRSHERYDPSLSLRAWVLGIARKRAIDHLRKRRDTVVSLDSVREITGEDGRDIADRLAWADDGPDEPAVDIDAAARRVFIWGLRPDHRGRIRSHLPAPDLARLQTLLSGY